MNSKRKNRDNPGPILLSACAKNLPIDLSIIGEKPGAVYRSRFLRMEETSEEVLLTIEAPALKGGIVPVRPGQNLKISFVLNGQDWIFETTIVARGKFHLNPQTTVSSLQLLAPEEVLSGGKRGFYRVTLDDAAPKTVRLAILAEEIEGKKRIRWRERGVMTDIGGGGLGFCISEGKSLLISPGAHLLLRFRLRPEGKELRLLGRVCFSLRQPELREAFFGVQFIDVDSEMEYKQAVDEILRFVAEEQRRNISEGTQTSQ
ncbi:MAG: flagellar brake protein [Candidatus Abyssubacteria bacterium]|nr:flagellar brake protein [Candidatus Abyssubacteria bacterium]